ncbi:MULTISPECIES: GntR family transcriptional regulator [Rhizobium]|uniref:GntR family transcriptional regulator n=1 Tax=Rhizobium TaxID=379 RepID=UPI001A987F07|nr:MULTISPECIES: GntR family transcriptional regulator [Rhizobium]MBX4892892.1 GntR family transcriptional regulator [Rhizobium bangladeshense]MBX4917286.1 GntR family transcriptional regulator [Rhizobium bangladeshense]MBX4922045.1 GntR family transcriptional regulator [Rhizobium bangladeshense]MBX4935361.1 GntR family transcriptional regulator [Rhizobium bangladeshense]MBX5013701.1 GntR family transcriptional regulator [Rhizobium lentis]
MSDGLAAMLPGWGKDIKGAGPLYQRLRLALVESILSGKLKKGDVLYPERDLAEHVRVSRVTVRKAIDHLVQDGFLVRRRGSGTFVAGSAVRADQPPLRANFLTGDTSWLESDTKVEWIERSTSYPAPEEMMTLGLSSDSRVVRITRLRSSAGQPLAIERICISSEFLPDTRTVTSSICNTLADASFRPVRAIQRTFALNIEDPDATTLGVAIGTAGLLTKRVAYLASGRAIEFSRSLFRGDAEGFVSELTFLEN